MLDSVLKYALDRVAVLDLVQREEAVRILRSAVVNGAADGAKSFLAEVDRGQWGMVDGLVHQATEAGRSIIDQWRAKTLAV